MILNKKSILGFMSWIKFPSIGQTSYLSAEIDGKFL